MVMWCNHQIIVGLRLVINMDTLETFVLNKLLILSDVLMLHIQLAILLCCHFVLLMYAIHFFFISKVVDLSNNCLLTLASDCHRLDL